MPYQNRLPASSFNGSIGTISIVWTEGAQKYLRELEARPAAYGENPKALTEHCAHETAASFGSARAVILYDDRETQFINIFA